MRLKKNEGVELIIRQIKKKKMLQVNFSWLRHVNRTRGDMNGRKNDKDTACVLKG